MNTRAELAAAAAVLRDRINDRAHARRRRRSSIPATTWIEPDVELEADATIHPFTVLRGRTRVAPGAEVGPHAVAIDAEIGERRDRRPVLLPSPRHECSAAGAKAGTFVEIKNSQIGDGTKVPHLSYIGDAERRRGHEHRRRRRSRRTSRTSPAGRRAGRRSAATSGPGIHNAFVAPVEVGDDAWIAAGSVITEDVPPESLAGFAPRQDNKEGYAAWRPGRLSSRSRASSAGRALRARSRSPSTGSSAGRRSG